MPPLHKEIRKAIEEAGSSPEFGAKLIRKFIQRHRDHQGGKP
jgi:hypothetical protein